MQLCVWEGLVTTHGYWIYYKYGTNSRTLDSLSLVAMTKVIKNFNQASYGRSLCNYQATEAVTEASLTGIRLPQPGSSVFPSEESRWPLVFLPGRPRIANIIRLKTNSDGCVGIYILKHFHDKSLPI